MKHLRTKNAAHVPDAILSELRALPGMIPGITPERLLLLVRHPAELLRRGWKLTGSDPVSWSIGTRSVGQRLLLLKARHQAVLESQAGRFIHHITVDLRRVEIVTAAYALD